MRVAVVGILLLAAITAVGEEVRLVVLHNPLHREILINPTQVTSLQQTREAGEGGKLVADTAQCVVSLADGKYFSVLEECAQVWELISPHR